MKATALPGRKHRIGLTASGDPLAREIRSLFRRAKFPVSRFVALAGTTKEGRLGELDGEAAYLEPLRAETVAGLDYLILAGSASDRKARELALAAEIPFHDAGQTPVAAHGCAALLDALTHPPSAAAFTLILPAAQEGDAGIRELFAQVSDALNLRPTAAKVFRDRLAFNLFRDAQIAKEERRIAAELQKLVPGGMVSVLCARAGIFHGYAGAACLDFGSAAGARKAREALSRSKLLSVGARPGHASPALSAEGTRVRLDPPELNGNRLSFWFAFDGLALAAGSALRAASARLG